MNDKIKSNFKKMLAREENDRCCVSITAPKNGACYYTEKCPDNPKDALYYWTDPEIVYNRLKKQIDSTFYLGDAYPMMNVALGAAGHAGFFKDSKYAFGDSIWFFKSLENIKDELTFQKDSFLYKKTIELTKYLNERNNGDYLVSIPDTCGNLDALAHLRSSSDLMIDMLLEDKEIINSQLDKIQKSWESITDECFEITKDKNDGSSIAWLDIWAPGKLVQMQCDMSVMFNNEMYNTFAMPELKAQSKHADYSLYHMDGCEQIRHLDSFLSIPDLTVVQWQRVQGQESVLNHIDSLKKIQKAGKSLQILVFENELETILKELSSKGLHLRIRAKNPEDAKDILKFVEKNSVFY